MSVHANAPFAEETMAASSEQTFEKYVWGGIYYCTDTMEKYGWVILGLSLLMYYSWSYVNEMYIAKAKDGEVNFMSGIILNRKKGGSKHDAAMRARYEKLDEEKKKKKFIDSLSDVPGPETSCCSSAADTKNSKQLAHSKKHEEDLSDEMKSAMMIAAMRKRLAKKENTLRSDDDRGPFFLGTNDTSQQPRRFGQDRRRGGGGGG